jgi:hypothetical protein
MWTYIQKNWRTNLVALIAFVYTVPQAVSCIESWVHHQSCDWREAVLGLLLAVGAAAAKDAGNIPTQGEVNQATVKQNIINTQNNQQTGTPIVWNK